MEATTQPLNEQTNLRVAFMLLLLLLASSSTFVCVCFFFCIKFNLWIYVCAFVWCSFFDRCLSFSLFCSLQSMDSHCILCVFTWLYNITNCRFIYCRMHCASHAYIWYIDRLRHTNRTRKRKHWWARARERDMWCDNVRNNVSRKSISLHCIALHYEWYLVGRLCRRIEYDGHKNKPNNSRQQAIF